MREDVTEITETRPVYRDGALFFIAQEVTGHEYWHFMKPSDGPRVGHLVGVVSSGGDFETRFQEMTDLMTEHREICPLYEEFMVEVPE
jgi:hypothetical protein